MAKSNVVTILDIGSGKIVGIAAEAISGGNSFKINALSEIKYNGFFEGDFVDESNTRDAIIKVLKQLENQTRERIKKIFIGVPGEFCVSAIRDAEITFNAPHKISVGDVNNLFNTADNFPTNPRYSEISKSSTYFILDGSRRETDPLGITASKLFGLVSFQFADRRFQKFIDRILKSYNIRNIEYISSSLAQSFYLFDTKTRDNIAVLIDMGYVTTSVSVLLGDGLVYGKSISLGSGFISDDLAQVLEIDYEYADVLRRKADLTLDFESEALYSVQGCDMQINANRTNEIIKARIEDIAEKISVCLDESGFFSKNCTAFITGGGLSYLRGGLSYLASCLEMPIKYVPVASSEFDRFDLTSAYGLAAVALMENNKKRGFFNKLLSGFGG